MNDKETKERMLEWCKKGHGPFSWPTDGCGLAQHIKFVKYRNDNFKRGDMYTTFVTDYVNTQLIVKEVK